MGGEETLANGEEKDPYDRPECQRCRHRWGNCPSWEACMKNPTWKPTTKIWKAPPDRCEVFDDDDGFEIYPEELE